MSVRETAERDIEMASAIWLNNTSTVRQIRQACSSTEHCTSHCHSVRPRAVLLAVHFNSRMAEASETVDLGSSPICTLSLELVQQIHRDYPGLMSLDLSNNCE